MHRAWALLNLGRRDETIKAREQVIPIFEARTYIKRADAALRYVDTSHYSGFPVFLEVTLHLYEGSLHEAGSY